MEGKPREDERGCRCPCTWGVTVLMVWVLGCRFHFIHPLGLPSIAAGASAIRLVHLAAAAPRLAVLGRPSAPWPGVPAPRVPQVLVLTPCRARGLCWPPRVPVPATHLGGQAASAWVRASRASVGRWGLLGRRPVWQTASSPSGVQPSSCFLALPPDRTSGKHQRKARLNTQASLSSLFDTFTEHVVGVGPRPTLTRCGAVSASAGVACICVKAPLMYSKHSLMTFC